MALQGIAPGLYTDNSNRIKFLIFPLTLSYICLTLFYIMENRTEKITIRTTPLEKLEWSINARNKNMTISEMIRKVMRAIAAGKIKRIPEVRNNDVNPPNR